LFTAQHLFLPLRTSHGPVGAIGVSRTGAALPPEEERLLAALIDQAAVAIERVQLAAKMDAARLAAETERLRSALLSSLSHDLKTPLASITGAATSLRHYGELYNAGAREELAATIQGEAERLSRFVANLLDMTRLRAGGIGLKREPVDLGETVGAALQRMQNVLGEHQVTVDLPADLPMLDLDVVLFEQVLVNLLDNAAKYSPPGSTVAISAKGTGPQVEITVSDEGPGIPPEDLEQVFEMFHRVTKGDRQRAGTGLGLSICRGFIEVLGGTIRATNRIDRSGAVFTITFPESVFTAMPREDAAE
jgi:two-component system sensor histidine kinase KdpD